MAPDIQYTIQYTWMNVRAFNFKYLFPKGLKKLSFFFNAHDV